MKIKIAEYLINQLAPRLFNIGLVPVSYPPLGAKYCKTKGLRKAINTVAKAFKPEVSEKISINKPIKKADIRSIHFGVSIGKIKINKRKNIGTISRLEIPILLNINNWRITRITKLSRPFPNTSILI
jgi:hypothetical protein